MVCVCDASVAELDMVHDLKEEHTVAAELDWARRRAKMARDAERGQLAAATRRENERKRKLQSQMYIDMSDCDDV